MHSYAHRTPCMSYDHSSGMSCCFMHLGVALTCHTGKKPTPTTDHYPPGKFCSSARSYHSNLSSGLEPVLKIPIVLPLRVLADLLPFFGDQKDNDLRAFEDIMPHIYSPVSLVVDSATVNKLMSTSVTIPVSVLSALADKDFGTSLTFPPSLRSSGLCSYQNPDCWLIRYVHALTYFRTATTP